MASGIAITLNGDPREVPPGHTLTALLEGLELKPLQVAIEVNQQLIPREHHDVHVLHAGDCVEVVTLVGGG